MDFGNPGLGLGQHSTAELGIVQEHGYRPSEPRILGGWLSIWQPDVMEQTHDFVITEPVEKSRVLAETTVAPKG